MDYERAKQIGIKAFVMKPILINEIAASIKMADDAMHKAKAQGRNRCCMMDRGAHEFD
jgi:PleD family two-component response regulator